jgi:AcrR family transcriptional regulator
MKALGSRIGVASAHDGLNDGIVPKSIDTVFEEMPSVQQLASGRALKRIEKEWGPVQSDDSSARRRFGLAALEISGEEGYRKLTVERILGRAELGRESFYGCFENAQSCYAIAYGDTAEELVSELLGLAYQEDGWRSGMRAALAGLGKFLEAEPMLARGMLLQVHVAGGAAIVKRDEVFERLSRAIDTARRENASRHSPPPIAAPVILNAVEAAASKHLRVEEPSRFAESIPDLLFLATAIYFGREAAEAELATGGC